MPDMRVSAFMSSPVISIVATTRLPQIKNLMAQHHIRRVPVLQQDQLIGIVSLGDVRSALPSDVTTLSIYEVTTLLYKVTAKDVMRTGVITVDADAALTEAAEQMLAHKVSGLPVMRDGRLAGIITESDIFRAVVGHSLALPVLEAVVCGGGQAEPRTVLPIV